VSHDKHVALFVALLASLLSDILLLILVRFSVRWLSANTNISRIARAVLIQIGVFALVIVMPIRKASKVSRTKAVERAQYGGHPQLAGRYC